MHTIQKKESDTLADIASRSCIQHVNQVNRITITTCRAANPIESSILALCQKAKPETCAMSHIRAQERVAFDL